MDFDVFKVFNMDFDVYNESGVFNEVDVYNKFDVVFDVIKESGVFN